MIHPPAVHTRAIIDIDEIVLDSLLSVPEDYERAEGLKAYLRQCGVME